MQGKSDIPENEEAYASFSATDAESRERHNENGNYGGFGEITLNPRNRKMSGNFSNL